MSGPIGLHGGGEFGPADGDFLGALLRAAEASRAARDRACAGVGPGSPADRDALRIAVLPTAAARSRPDLAVAHGRTAFERVAASAGIGVRVEGIEVLDRADAERAVPAGRLVGADVIYLVGGDPGHLLDVLEGSLAWRSVLAAHAHGAAVAGASAGAMVLGAWTWAPGGGRRALGLVPGIAVVPHFEPARLDAWAAAASAAGADERLAWVGLDEATGIILAPDRGLGDGRRGNDGAWQVHGPGLVRWFPAEGRSVGPLAGGSRLPST